MKVVHVIFSFMTGGSETMLVDIINRQCEENAVSLIVIKDLVNEDLLKTIDRRVDIFLLKGKGNVKMHFLPLFIKINAVVASICPDVIHCHDIALFPFFIRWKRRTCLTVHSVGLPALLMKQYQRVFAISEVVREDLKRRAGVDARVVYNGIEIADYKPRTSYVLEEGEVFKVVQLGRLHPKQKGQDIAIQALSLLKQQHPEINIRLYLVGGGALPELQALAERYQLLDEVVFVGQVDRDWVKNHLQDYHLKIQPSLLEGFGLTVVEGFACGLPVVASDLDGPREIINRLKVGLLVAPGNVAELSDGILKVYQAYKSNTLVNTNYLLHDKDRLALFDVRTTAQNYLKNYKFS
jgi:glycosyltransferase involved in cell wall biosynthesis